MDIWKTWDQINSISEGREIYLYGRSDDWVHKSIPKLSRKPRAIVDQDAAFHNTSYLDIPVVALSSIQTQDNPFFLITAGAYTGIVSTLQGKGFLPGIDFACSPDFKDYAALQDLNNMEEQILFSSSDYPDPNRARGTAEGGGLYLLSTVSGSIQRVAKGSYRQFAVLKNGGAVALEFVEKQIHFFDSNFELMKSFELQKANFCGLAVSEQHNLLSIVNSGSDEIETFHLEGLAHLESRPFSKNSSGMGHHLNDCIYDERGVLYCSFFSFSGSYKAGNYDGGLATLTPLKPSEPVQLANGLWKPHSPLIEKSGELWVLDSMRGQLRTSDGIRAIIFPGFVRGLDEKNGLFAVGQSQNMYFTERDRTEPTMVNSGIHVLDRNANAYRTFLAHSIMNIHQLAFLSK